MLSQIIGPFLMEVLSGNLTVWHGGNVYKTKLLTKIRPIF